MACAGVGVSSAATIKAKLLLPRYLVASVVARRIVDAMFKILGGACIVFGLVDFASDRFFEYDMTGFQYSAFAACIVGWLPMKVGSGSGEQGRGASQAEE